MKELNWIQKKILIFEVTFGSYSGDWWERGIVCILKISSFLLFPFFWFFQVMFCVVIYFLEWKLTKTDMLAITVIWVLSFNLLRFALVLYNRWIFSSFFNLFLSFFLASSFLHLYNIFFFQSSHLNWRRIQWYSYKALQMNKGILKIMKIIAENLRHTVLFYCHSQFRIANKQTKKSNNNELRFGNDFLNIVFLFCFDIN